MLRACPHHGFTELTQVDTFYNWLNDNDQDSLNAAAGENLLSKMTREALNIIKNKSKECYSRNKPNASRMNTTSRENVSKTDERIDKLADQLSTLVEIVSTKVVTPAPIKAVEETCVTCGGAHSYFMPPSISNAAIDIREKVLTVSFIRGIEEIETYLKDDSISSEIDHADCDPEGDICLIEKLLNNDPFQLPPMDLKQSEVTKAKSSIEEPPELELKDLPSHLEYAYLEENNKLLVIIAKGLKDDEKEALLKAITWKITDIKGIDPRFCTLKILKEDDYKPTVQSQRRVSPVHCVPKKGGITVVANEENELIPTRIVTGWRVCIEYRKLNEATRKDHFPLPLMDQMLERLAVYCDVRRLLFFRFLLLVLVMLCRVNPKFSEDSRVRLSVSGNSRRTKNDRVKYELDAKQGLVGNLKSSCTDIAKITRKRSKPDKHRHENG
ncbi:hypothetical protein Tco_0189681 [Tanacetum coccineum]